ncbi:MAG: hypothetical protein JNL08_14505 [Planctomycetes bacterium]|nr:hypothetical protein [Planctomycetota bacterium]
MTQLEVPQISLQRYLDLLKRRRWQVIPVSLIGLVVGGLVAFFIPRYYVADTLVVHQMVPGKADPKNPEDPFRAIVDSAELTMKLAVGETMRELRWPEALVADPSLRTRNERVVRDALRVFDINRGDKDRRFAQIQVIYRDLDGQRAADFLNKLVPTWVAAQLREFREPAEAEQREAADAVQNHRRLYELLLQERRQLAVEYLFDPSNPLQFLQQMQKAEEQRVLRELRDTRDQKQREVEALRLMVDVDRQALALMEARVAPDPELLLAEAKKTPEGTVLTAALERYRKSLRNFHPGTAEHRQALLGIEQTELLLRELVGGAVDPDGRMVNPAHTALQAKVEQAASQLAAQEAELGALEAQLAAESEGVLRRAQGLIEYERKSAQFDQTRRDLADAEQRLRDANAVVASLGKQQTVQQVGAAQPPPRPTEPNILVVALLGCVLGLGAAIGLILLLDVVQGTFKTIDDVERGLPVPVLGGMSHLETTAERDQNVRRRRRASLIAATMVALVVIVVTIFYVDPTRLHPAVRDLLAMLLGN